MSFEFKKTSGGKFRGAMCDNETHVSIEIFKNVSYLRPTYQIKLLAYQAAKTNKCLIIKVPEACVLSPAMERLKRTVIDNSEYKQEVIRVLRKKN